MEETATAANKQAEAEEIQKPRPSCMERGPGPARYMLPSTCGHVKHDPTKVSKPAYSFGTKPKKASAMNSPGPVYFLNPYITRNGMSTMPSFTMYGRINLPSGSGNYPSPDTYHIENTKPLKTAQPPSFSFGSRTKYLKKDNVPSPSTYTLPPMIGPRVVNKKSGSAPSMTGRSLIGSFHQDFQKTPGPGTYKVTDSSVTSTKCPSYTLKGRNYPAAARSQAPAPGTYKPENVKVDKRIYPSYSFGVRHSDYLTSFVEMGLY
ncbi:PREDICTED: outer dense fiber protein 3-like [Amphimedon queenslandica]|uniref:Uncharacterized protein n=1 Tax=Amphimedon queenslandica TaxID=400682 RepID=A0A1X7VP68_AMPQE|nr:PREDICTED: outer dense fiber protein 3-like [Amphimedon queenslandica]|eukprot:XP_003383407.1 PREDICTED: outer dense fiber protein 3-like [Amphimedon queenslandica]